MNSIIDLYQRAVRLCLFKIAPAEMPSGQAIMQWSVLIYFLISIPTARLQVDGLGASAILAAIETVLFIALIYALLMMRGRGERVTKTMTAMMSSGTVMGVMGIPLLMQVPDDPAEASTWLSFLLLIFVLWSLMIMAHILRHAMDIKPSMAAIVSVVVLVIMMLVDGFLLATVT